ncbi:MAG TPA: formate/nitrite transporter family protein [Dehalococcoidia bacterium]|nr:formate/nitrite transporter family protein [Dehalococcoidia bacterium]
MTDATVIAAAEAAKTKAGYLRSHPLGYLILSAMAGIYVGFGIVLIFAIGAPFLAANSPAAKLAMGASFGIALSLVIVAGAELFTGNNMVMTIGVLRRTSSPIALTAVWLVSFIGNLIGSLALAWLVAKSGVFAAAPHQAIIERTVATKMALPFGALFFRGVLCNWLVCLAVWCAMRSTSEAGKLIMIFWCLFAFIGAGFEHSVANMTLLGIGLFQAHGSAVTWAGFAHNMEAVTLGNIVGGALFVGGAYWLANQKLSLFTGRVPAESPGMLPEGAGGD